ncbi:MAG: hypothetical protein ACXVGB_00140 [Mycobacteriaceae bacterium]
MVSKYDDRSKYPFKDASTPAGRQTRLKAKYLASRNDPSTNAKPTRGK